MDKIISYITLLILLLFVSPIYAQNESQELEKLWEKIVQNYEDSVELVLPLTDQIISILDDPVDSAQYIRAIKYKGRAHRIIGNYGPSIDAFQEVYKYAGYHKDSSLLVEAADQIATMNIFMGNMSDGQAYLLEAVEIYNRIGSKVEIANANNGLAIFYDDMGQKDKAIEMYKLALSQSEEIKDTLGQANVHANLGMLYLDEGSYNLAEYHILKQGYLDTLLKTQWGLGFHHDFMGSLRRKQKRYQEALKWKKSALDIRKDLSSQYNIAESNSGLANIYLTLGDNDKAIEHAQKILQTKALHESLSQQMAAYSYLGQAYENKGDYKQALEFQQAYKMMSDSIYNRDLVDEIARKDALYEKAKQDKEIALLQADKLQSENKIRYKNKIILLCIIGLALITFLIGLLYKLFKKVSSQKEELSITLNEKNVLLREIHHRVKNNLQLISSILTLQGRSLNSESAQEAIADGKSRVRSMALIHQDLYTNKNLTGIGVKQYLEKLTSELFSTYNTNGKKVHLEMEIEDCELDVDTMVPLGLIINELVTNSLKYAFPNGNEGTINVKLQEQKEGLFLEIKDNGIGYNPEKIREGSFGTTLIHALTDQLGGELVRTFENGTKINIHLKEYKKII